jgi:hypothetical protein
MVEASARGSGVGRALVYLTLGFEESATYFRKRPG